MMVKALLRSRSFTAADTMRRCVDMGARLGEEANERLFPFLLQASGGTSGTARK